MVVRLGFRQFFRDIKSGEIKIAAFALILASLAISTTTFLKIAFNNALEDKTGELIAADRLLESDSKIDNKWQERLNKEGFTTANIVSFLSMVGNDDLILSQVKGASSNYPLRGELIVKDTRDSTEYVSTDIPKSNEAWVEEKLLSLLDLDVGDSIDVGYLQFKITKIVVTEPDRTGSFFALAPRTLINYDDAFKTRLLQPGTRATFSLLFAGERYAISEIVEQLKEEVDVGLRVLDAKEAKPGVETALERGELYISLAVMVNLILAGIVISIAARRYSLRHLDEIGVLKALGAKDKEILTIFTISLSLLALVCGLIGSFLGYAAKIGIANFVTTFIKIEVTQFYSLPIIFGTVTSFLMLVGFALGPIANLKNVSAMRVLRKDAVPRSFQATTLYLVAFLSLAVLLFIQTDEYLLGCLFLLGIILVGYLVVILSSNLLAITMWLKELKILELKLAVNNILRQQRESAVSVVAFSLALTVALILFSVRTSLVDNWQAKLKPNTPNNFAINIPKELKTEFQGKIAEAGIEASEVYPMVRGRLVKVNDDEDVVKRGVTRAWNLTYGLETMPDNEIIQGRAFTEDDIGKMIVSVEKGVADRLGVKLGDFLEFQVGSQKFATKIVNLRTVEWDNFKPNFFTQFPPGVLDNLPTTYINSFYLADNEYSKIVGVIKDYPEVTIVDVASILMQVRSILNITAKAVNFLWVFTLIVGIVLLFAVSVATIDERIRESAIIRSLGATKKLLNRTFFFEFVMLGAFSGLVACIATLIIDYAITAYVFELPYTFQPIIYISGLLSGIILVTFFGLLGIRKVLSKPPITLLNEF